MSSHRFCVTSRRFKSEVVGHFDPIGLERINGFHKTWSRIGFKPGCGTVAPGVSPAQSRIAAGTAAFTEGKKGNGSTCDQRCVGPRTLSGLRCQSPQQNDWCIRSSFVIPIIRVISVICTAAWGRADPRQGVSPTPTPTATATATATPTPTATAVVAGVPPAS